MFDSQYNPEIEEKARQQLLEKMSSDRVAPESQDNLPNGTPGEYISNTTPWIDKIGLWKANDGKDPNWKPKTTLVIGEPEAAEDDEEGILSDEELDALIAKADGSGEEEGGEVEEDYLSEEEIQALVSELLDDEPESDSEEVKPEEE